MPTIAKSEPRRGLTAVAWYPPEEMSLGQWAEQGRRLGIMGRSAGWWIGDWLAYGNAAYGERYVRAARITGLDAKTLRNMVYVASHVEPSRRRSDLSWSHHAEVVVLVEEEQEYWLARAEQERFSVRDLRRAIKDEQRGLSVTAKEAASSSRANGADSYRGAGGHGEQVVCPYCGRDFASADVRPSKVTVLAGP